MSNLRLINETEITSGVSSFSVTDIFTDDFDIYKIVLSNVSTNSNSILQYRFVNSAGSVITSSSYSRANLNLRDTSAFAEYYNNVTNAGFGFESPGASPEGYSSVVYIFNPTNTSSYTFALYQAMGITSSLVRGNKGIGVLLDTTNIKGINIYLGSPTFTSGFIRTYGLRVDS
jgi:hypothetical protein